MSEPLPKIDYELWSSWKQPNGGAGRCEGCPAHWSVREDYHGEAESRRSSFDHYPIFAYGDSNPEIVIVAEGPGTPNDDDSPPPDVNQRERDLEDVRSESITDAMNETLEFAEPLFTAVEESEFDSHFTQVRKCNQIEYGGSDDRARKHCAGAGQFDGYLYEEMDALDPEAVITITTRGGAEFSEVFDLPRMKTKAMAQGSGESGFRVRVQDKDEIGFRWYPAPHPDPRGACQTYNHLDDIESKTDEANATKSYFKLFVDEVLEDIRQTTA